MRHTSDHPRTDRFIRAIPALLTGDWCGRCFRDAADHKTARYDDGALGIHCDSCVCGWCS